MEYHEYKCVPAPTSFDVGKKGNQIKIAQAYEQIINASSVGGWEFDKVATVNSYVPPGCIATLFGLSEAKPVNQYSEPIVKRMTMEEYKARKAAKNS